MIQGEPRWYIGYDPAELADYSAVVVVQKAEKRMLLVRYILRYPRGTAYAEQAKSLAALYRALVNPLGCILTADATGLGEPVCQMIEARGVPVKRITITAGEAEGKSGKSTTVPKAKLVGALVRVIGEDRLRVSNEVENGEALSDELKAFSLKRKRTGYEAYEAGGEYHDDLVLATCLAVREADRGHVIHGVGTYLRLKAAGEVE